MQYSKHKRRNSEQWCEIVDQYQASPLSAPKFCAEHGISYASFIKWKRRLLSDTSGVAKRVPEFVELTPTPETPNQWHIELDLAPGIQLRIARGV